MKIDEIKSGLSELIKSARIFENGSRPLWQTIWFHNFFEVEEPKESHNYQACSSSKVAKFCLKEHPPTTHSTNFLHEAIAACFSLILLNR